MGSGISPATEKDAPAESLLGDVKPGIISRESLIRAYQKDPCLKKITQRIEQLRASIKAGPQQEALKAQWKKVVKEHEKYIEMKYVRTWGQQHLREMLLQRSGRMIAVKEQLEARRVGAIKMKLGAKFLRSVPGKRLYRMRRSASLSKQPMEITPQPPPPSTSIPPTSPTA